MSRVCLNMLQARRSRPEVPLGPGAPEPAAEPASGSDPEHEALLADSVGLALLVVLDTLHPPERVAFVLHDMFAMPFDEIAPIVGRSAPAARQLASRARRRVQRAGRRARRRPASARPSSSTRSSPPRATATSTRCSPSLDPDVVLRADADRGRGSAPRRRPAGPPASRDVLAVRARRHAGAPRRRGGGRLDRRAAAPRVVYDFTISDERIVAIDLIADPERLSEFDLAILGSPGVSR